MTPCQVKKDHYCTFLASHSSVAFPQDHPKRASTELHRTGRQFCSRGPRTERWREIKNENGDISSPKAARPASHPRKHAHISRAPPIRSPVEQRGVWQSRPGPEHPQAVSALEGGGAAGGSRPAGVPALLPGGPGAACDARVRQPGRLGGT